MMVETMNEGKKLKIKNKLHYWDLLDTDKDVASAVRNMIRGNLDNTIPTIETVMVVHNLTKKQSETAITLAKFYLSKVVQ